MWSLHILVNHIRDREIIIFQGHMTHIYRDIARHTQVAEGRGMALDEVREAAKGRVWSGRDAERMGLVDRLGGLQDAVAWARAAVPTAPVWPSVTAFTDTTAFSDNL